MAARLFLVMAWRLVEQETYNAAMNMAIDHSIYESVANGGLPAIRFYKWLPSSISLGAYQNPKEIDFEECRKNSIWVVRRMTGGRAVFHDKADFTYSVIAPIKVFGHSIENAYREICGCIINSLQELGINASLENKNDVMADGRKISGNAAKLMDKGVYLQHGTLVYDIDFDIMPKVLNISQKIAKEKIASVLEFRKINNEQVYQSLKNNFIKDKDIKIEKLSKEEIKRAVELAGTKYSSVEVSNDVLLRNKGACYVMSGN